MCGWEVNRFGSGLFSIAVFGTSGVECFVSACKKFVNLLKPNDIYIYIYICCNAALTSRRYILNIYSTNTHTEYFKHAA